MITTELNQAALIKLATNLRYAIIANSHKTGTPHLGSCLSCLDILVYLYWQVLNVKPEKPRDPLRDRFILSKGHGAPALFHVLAEKGFYSKARLADYGVDGSVFAEHPPTPSHLPGIEAATGSLGHGMPMGLGMALSSRITNESYQVHVIVGDGECNEGSIWEAAMLASAQKVNNLTVWIDYNKWQATDRSQNVLALDPLIDKWRSFGWDALEIDGHSFIEMHQAMSQLKNSIHPRVVIAHTIKGKGVSFMQDDNNWHYKIPNAEELKMAQTELGISL